MEEGKLLKERKWVCFQKNGRGLLVRKRAPEVHCLGYDGLGGWGMSSTRRNFHKLLEKLACVFLGLWKGVVVSDGD